MLRWLLVCLFFTASAAASLFAGALPPADLSKFTMPRDAARRIQESRLTYVFKPLDSSSIDSILHPAIFVNEWLYLGRDSANRPEFRTFELSDSSEILLSIADAALVARDFPTAFAAYREVAEGQPELAKTQALIGRAFFLEESFDSAIVYLQRAIDRNFFDFRAHWWLADALWMRGDSTSAVREMTAAHLLNVNEPTLLSRLKMGREQIGKPWLDWELTPLWKLSASLDGTKVTVEAPPLWRYYAMELALWVFEPGYAEERAGRPVDMENEGLLLFRAALHCWMVDVTETSTRQPDSVETFVSTLWLLERSGGLDAYILYSLILPHSPQAVLQLDRTVFDKMVDYVDWIHTPAKRSTAPKSK